MPLRDEKAKHPAERRQRARHRSRGDPRAAQRLEVADDVEPLDLLEPHLLIGEPRAESPQVGAIRRERILGQSFLDGEVVEVERQVCGVGVHSAATTSAMYELRTNGPAKTARKPMASPASRYSSKTRGSTYSTTSSFSRFGCRYCPMVTISHPASSRRRRTSTTSSRRSPRPSISPDFVTRVGSRRFASRSTAMERAKREPGRTWSYSRGTVSTLWLK